MYKWAIETTEHLSSWCVYCMFFFQLFNLCLGLFEKKKKVISIFCTRAVLCISYTVCIFVSQQAYSVKQWCVYILHNTHADVQTRTLSQMWTVVLINTSCSLLMPCQQHVSHLLSPKKKDTHSTNRQSVWFAIFKKRTTHSGARGFKCKWGVKSPSWS